MGGSASNWFVNALFGTIGSPGDAASRGIPAAQPHSAQPWLNYPGAATGANFIVGGKPGIDKNMIAFRASRGERVMVMTPNQTDNQPMTPIVNISFEGANIQAAKEEELLKVAQYAQQAAVATVYRDRRTGKLK